MLEYRPGIDSRIVALLIVEEFVHRVRLGEYAKEGPMPEIVVASIKVLADGVTPPAKLSIPEIGVTLVVLAPDDRRMLINA